MQDPSIYTPPILLENVGYDDSSLRGYYSNGDSEWFAIDALFPVVDTDSIESWEIVDVEIVDAEDWLVRVRLKGETVDGHRFNLEIDNELDLF